MSIAPSPAVDNDNHFYPNEDLQMDEQLPQQNNSDMLNYESLFFYFADQTKQISYEQFKASNFNIPALLFAAVVDGLLYFVMAFNVAGMWNVDSVKNPFYFIAFSAAVLFLACLSIVCFFRFAHASTDFSFLRSLSVYKTFAEFQMTTSWFRIMNDFKIIILSIAVGAALLGRVISGPCDDPNNTNFWGNQGCNDMASVQNIPIEFVYAFAFGILQYQMLFKGTRLSSVMFAHAIFNVSVNVCLYLLNAYENFFLMNWGFVITILLSYEFERTTYVRFLDFEDRRVAVEAQSRLEHEFLGKQKELLEEQKQLLQAKKDHVRFISHEVEDIHITLSLLDVP